MVFNSFSFLIFFVAVFACYYFIPIKNNKTQNFILLIASYVFYGIASWKLLPVLIVATTVFYFLGLQISKSSEGKALWLKIIGIAIGVGLLLYFKYLNFFIESFAALLNFFGLTTNWSSFNIIMPLGISFFTFKLISYVIEVEHEEIKPSTDFIEFAAYIAFFPCILSGPIDRPNDFLPQLKQKRSFSYSKLTDAFMQFIWGLFKKMVIADNCAAVVNTVWNSLESQRSSTMLLAALLYVFQVYADFSGYSDMAIGVGKALGIKVTSNFKHPLFALNIAEYWRRWHISLTKWMTDYVFMPLNFIFRKHKMWGTMIAITINFILVGLWHGANWVFAIFGLLQAIWFIPLIITGEFMKNEEIRVNRFHLPVFKHLCKILLTFLIIVINGILFRSANINEFWSYICGIFKPSLLSLPSFVAQTNTTAMLCVAFIIALIIMDWISKDDEYFLEKNKNLLTRCIFVLLFVLSIYYIGGGSDTFIYFQF